MKKKAEMKKEKYSVFQSAEISANAKVILEKRYLRKDQKGEICETPDQMFHRVADALAYPELEYGKTQEETKDIMLT